MSSSTNTKNTSKFSEFSKEAKFLKTRILDSSLLDIFTGEREGSEEERIQLNSAIKKLEKRIYIEAVFLLTHTLVENEKEAYKIFDDIIHHRNSMVKALKRNVSVQVAALDYVQNIRNILKRPTIIEEDKYEAFAYRATFDETTQAFDKDLLDTEIESQVEQSKRFGSVFSVLFIDLDDLKTINDTYGHETGTKAIKCVSNCTSSNLRKYDSIFRYGGDEFVVILPRNDKEDSLKTAKRIIEVVNQSTFEGLPLKIGISIGIATFDNLLIQTGKSLLNAADEALYSAKKMGKNCISVYGENKTDIHKKEKKYNGNVPALINKKVVKGIPIVDGIGIGKIFLYHDILTRDIEVREIKQYEVESEMHRVLRAVDKVKCDLVGLRETLEKAIGITHASIFDVHKTILDDAELLTKIENELKISMVNSEHAVRNVFRQLEKQFKGSASNIIREKVFDIKDIGKRIMDVMIGSDESVLNSIHKDTVVVARRLLPSDTIHFTNRKPVAIVTEEGGTHSHSALLAKAMGIPSISGIPFLQSEIVKGSDAIVNGSEGVIIINPEKKDREIYAGKYMAAVQQKNRVFNLSHKHADIIKNQKINVCANISSHDECINAANMECDYIGLFRMEPMLMLFHTFPEEQHLYILLYKALKPLRAKKIIMRLADIGGDKFLSYLTIDMQHNALLGIRGVRFLAHNIQFLNLLLKVIFRLRTTYDIDILIPFVNSKYDVLLIKQAIEQLQNEYSDDIRYNTHDIRIGAMIETPIAALSADEIVKCTDFISIGTNDLIQYLTAADRESIAVSQYYQDGTSGALHLVKDIIGKAKKINKRCIMCGELAGNTDFTDALLQMGLEHFSVLPPLIPIIKEKVYQYMTGKPSSWKG